MDFLVRYMNELWSLLVDTGWWLLAGLLFAGAVHAFFPTGWLSKHLGKRGLGSVAKASAAGIVMPLCSCSVIPVAAGLRRGGASKGASAAFAISTPQTGEESIPLTWALLGPVFAIVRPIVAILTALVAGVLIDGLAGDTKKPASEPGGAGPAPKACCGGGAKVIEAPKTVSLGVASCCGGGGGGEKAEAVPAPEPAKSHSCCSHEESVAAKAGIGAKLRSALRYGLVTLPVDLAPWLAVGFLLSALIAAGVPEGWIESNIGTGIVPMLAMLVVGLPLYICATSSTPLVYTLVAAGLSPGAALVLLLAGPATNFATMAWTLRDLGVKATAIYLVSIAGVALGAGLLLDALALDVIRSAVADTHAGHDHAAVSVAAGVGGAVLAVLLLGALAKRGYDGLVARRDDTGDSEAGSHPSSPHAEHAHA